MTESAHASTALADDTWSSQETSDTWSSQETSDTSGGQNTSETVDAQGAIGTQNPDGPAHNSPQPQTLSRDQWRARELAHEHRADTLTAGWRARRASGETDEVEDFLFTYYSFRPALLRRWHPGAGVVLENASDDARASWRWYISLHADRPANGANGANGANSANSANGTNGTNAAAHTPPNALHVDATAFLTERGNAVDFVETLLRRTLERSARIGCNCLHEWAMVYHTREGEQRHTNLPLRLGHAGTDRVVEASQITCSHFDAFRFFTEDARGLNELQPARQAQLELEQPGCLHANMDLYKWATKLGPLIPGELLLDTFELAREIRDLDMQASPYDVRDHGLEPVRIETPAGRAEFARRQREFSTRADRLRRRMLHAIMLARTTAA